jgi:hypothetical protein
LYDKSIIKSGKPTQLDNLVKWRGFDKSVLPREVIIRVEADAELNHLFKMLDEKKTLPLITKLAENNIDIYIGAQLLSASEMNTYSDIFLKLHYTKTLPLNFHEGIKTLSGIRATFKNLK